MLSVFSGRQLYKHLQGSGPQSRRRNESYGSSNHIAEEQHNRKRGKNVDAKERKKRRRTFQRWTSKKELRAEE
jgi:hypothetical protein